VKDTKHYPVDVFYSDDDEGYIALATDLPGCSAFGETRAEAVDELQDAICAWIEASEKAGNPIPEPSKRMADSLPSGKILLRLPRTLHGQLVEQAQREGTSLNQFLLYVITSNTSARAVGTAVAEKILATASYAGANMMTTLASQSLSTMVINTSAQRVGSSLVDRIIVAADTVNVTDVVTYGTTLRSAGFTDFVEAGFGPVIKGRARAHG